MVSTRLEWNGDKEKKDMTGAIIKALLRSTNLVRSSAVSNVPVDTGNLRGSIRSGVDAKALTGRVDTNVEYAANVEFGTRFQRPQPYLKPALDDNKDNIRNIFIKEGENAIGK